MKSPRLFFLILLCAVVLRGLGDLGATFIGMDGGIHPRISPKGNHMAVSYQGAIVVTEPGEFEITVTRAALKAHLPSIRLSARSSRE